MTRECRNRMTLLVDGVRFYVTKHAAEQYKNKYGGDYLSIDDFIRIFALFNQKALQRLLMQDKRGVVKRGSCKFQFAYRTIVNNVVTDFLIQHIPNQVPRIITFYDPPMDPKNLIIKNYRH